MFSKDGQFKMNENNQYPLHSPLSQSCTRKGKTVQVEIYEDGAGGWLLEVVDEHWNSTVWDQSFQSDKDALDEAIRTIDEEGIDSLIGAPPDSPAIRQQANQPKMKSDLSQDDMDELGNFLLSDATSDETMTMDCLDGFLTAIVSGPVMIPPSVWMSKIWGQKENDEPVFESMAKAGRITDLIMQHLNVIIWSLYQNPDAFEPIFDIAAYPNESREYVDGEMWAYGYMTGIDLQRKDWKAFFDEPTSAEVLRPIYLLGADEVLPEEEALIETPAQREVLSNRISASVAGIYKFWQPYRRAIAERGIATSFQREHPKVGRNDPCPCGSGMKFKKCCGAATVLH
jgi:uncharacterized protein